MIIGDSCLLSLRLSETTCVLSGVQWARIMVYFKVGWLKCLCSAVLIAAKPVKGGKKSLFLKRNVALPRNDIMNTVGATWKGFFHSNDCVGKRSFEKIKAELSWYISPRITQSTIHPPSKTLGHSTQTEGTPPQCHVNLHFAPGSCMSVKAWLMAP